MRKKMAVVRALDVRLIQAEYAAQFKKLEPFFVSNDSRRVNKYLIRAGVEHIKLKLVPTYLVDPVSMLLRKTGPQSWLGFERKSLEKELKLIDIYQIQEPFFLYSGQVADVARKFNKSLITAPWMCFNHLSTYIPPYCWSVKRVIEQTDLFILRTKRVNNYLSNFKIPDSKKALVYHGINTKRFYPRKEKTDEKIRIVFVGALGKHKGLDDILDIFPKLVKTAKKKVELVVYGRGVLESRVREMSKDLPIKYMGKASNSALAEAYRQADIFCGPSKDWFWLGMKRTEEGFGWVFAEAMASGLPVVTNDCGAITEVVGDKNMVNKQGDKQALLKSLLKLISDSKLRQEMGKDNRLRALKMFDLAKQVAKEEEIILKYV